MKRSKKREWNKGKKFYRDYLFLNPNTSLLNTCKLKIKLINKSACLFIKRSIMFKSSVKAQ